MLQVNTKTGGSRRYYAFGARGLQLKVLKHSALLRTIQNQVHIRSTRTCAVDTIYDNGERLDNNVGRPLHDRLHLGGEGQDGTRDRALGHALTC